MEQSTPSDLLFHLNQHNYQAALDIARELQLDTDAIYKAQWKHQRGLRETALVADDVQILHHITDDAWVASECLETLVDDYELQRTILSIGKTRTEKHTLVLSQHINESTENTLANTDSDTIWLQTQQHFSRYLNRLMTFIDIWPSLPERRKRSFSKAYGQFRDANLVAQAIEYAWEENHAALHAIFSQQGSEVHPQRIAVVSEIPECADPSQYDLPRVVEGQETSWFTDSPQHQKELEQDPNIRDVIESPPTEYIAYLGSLNQLFPPTEFPASAKELEAWFLSKSEAADHMGLCSQALAWVRYARMMGITGLEQRETRLNWLCNYVYNASINEEDGSVVDLDAFDKLPRDKVLEGLLEPTSEARIVEDMKQYAIPWLQYCAQNADKDDSEQTRMLLYHWILNTATAHLEWCCRIFESSKPTLLDDERIITDDLDLSRLALAIAYSTQGAVHNFVRLFECMPIFDPWEAGEDQDSEEHVTMTTVIALAETPLDIFNVLQSVGVYGLSQMLDALQDHLASAEVLERYHASIPLSHYLREPSVDVQRRLCIRMASQAAGGVETQGKQFDSDNDWRELFDDMMRLRGENRSGVFGLLSPTEIFEIFFTALLRSGRFQLAKDLMVGPGRNKDLDIGRAEQLVIDAEQEFFDNATSGNKYTGNLKLALECLDILPPTDLVNEERDLIDATHTLISEYKVADRPGFELMPIQVRQATNRLDLISKLINTRRGIYRQPDQVLNLAKKLGYHDDILAEVKVLAMLAGAALVDEDYDTSYKLCRTTVDKVQSVRDRTPQGGKKYVEEISQAAWQVCYNLGKLDAYHDYHKRLDVLSMALAVSPIQDVQVILTAWRHIEEKYHPETDATSQMNLLLDAHSGDLGEHSSDANGRGWQNLLNSAKRHQWRLGDLLKTGEHDGKRKRDQLRDMVGGWLF